MPHNEPPDSAPATQRASAVWPEIRFRVPPEWKLWLEQAAAARAMSVAALVRQLVRDLMLERHRDDERPAA